MNFNFIILLLGISFSYIAMEQSAVIRDVPLNWTEARNECRETNSHLLNFFEMKNRLDYFKSALIQNTKYWVAETWKEKIYFVKGCQSKIQGLSMVIDQGNIFSECVKYCENQNYTTIGLQGSTCSCIVKENFENLESNSCDIECAWNNISCRAEKCSFAIYQLAKDVPQRLPGDLFDDCVYYNTIIKFSRDDCNKKYHFICQGNNGELKVHDILFTWMEAYENCSKEHMILANINKNTMLGIRHIEDNKKYWIGLRQMYIYQKDMKSFLCSFIQKYNSIGLLTYSREDCSINTPYLCLEGKERSIYVLHEIFYLHLLLQSVK
ncbi:uncharacterized protein LOC134280066 isoform X1 [Saccostrea cucullata]|uniref:uncharacterized protein LOC134280066 isoform X1 n=1 Tax=Saccostrea cuccullata TaxID=36930 RepID=UPI002ED2CA4B